MNMIDSLPPEYSPFHSLQISSYHVDSVWLADRPLDPGTAHMGKDITLRYVPPRWQRTTLLTLLTN
jgi:hypothetical protein